MEISAITNCLCDSEMAITFFFCIIIFYLRKPANGKAKQPAVAVTVLRVKRTATIQSIRFVSTTVVMITSY